MGYNRRWIEQEKFGEPSEGGSPLNLHDTCTYSKLVRFCQKKARIIRRFLKCKHFALCTLSQYLVRVCFSCAV